MNVKSIDKQYVANTYNRFDLQIVSGKGSLVYDENGKEYYLYVEDSTMLGVSYAIGVEIIRDAKADGVRVTCETGPHYLILDDSNLCENARFKMNPPLRSKEDRDALIEGIKDGTIDMIATDHAPHSEEEKSRGLEKSAFGVVGLETSFASLYTHLVKTGVITLEKLIDIMSTKPKTRFNIEDNGITVFDLEEKFTVNPQEFLSKGKATPFEGMEFYGVCHYTELNGKPVYEK